MQNPIIYTEKPKMTRYEFVDYFDRMKRLSMPPGYFNISIRDNVDVVIVAPDFNLREFVRWQIEFLSKHYTLPPIDFLDRG